MGQNNERERVVRTPSKKGPWHDHHTPKKIIPGVTPQDKAQQSNGLPDSDIDEQRQQSLGTSQRTAYKKYTRELATWYRYTLSAIGLILIGTVIIQIGANRYSMALQKTLKNLQTNTALPTPPAVSYEQHSSAQLAQALRFISGVIPARVRLEQVTLDIETGDKLTITGYGRDSNAALSFIQSLSVHFDDIDASIESDEEEDDEECYFTLSFGLAGTSGAHDED